MLLSGLGQTLVHTLLALPHSALVLLKICQPLSIIETFLSTLPWALSQAAFVQSMIVIFAGGKTGLSAAVTGVGGGWRLSFGKGMGTG